MKKNLLALIFMTVPMWAMNFKGTSFEKACGELSLNPKGPQLNDRFFQLAISSESKSEFYEKLKSDSLYKPLTKFFTVIGKSSSREKENSTPDFPRIIGFGGSMVIASADHPHPKNIKTANIVEGIAYASQAFEVWGEKMSANKLHFFQIDFTHKIPEIQIPGEGCQKCHFGKFNWETFQDWPGTSSSKTDYIRQTVEVPLSKELVKDAIQSYYGHYSDASDDDQQTPKIEDQVVEDVLSRITQVKPHDDNSRSIYAALRMKGYRYNQKTKEWKQNATVKREMTGIYKSLDFSTNEGGNRDLNLFVNSIMYEKMTRNIAELKSWSSKRKRIAALASVLECGWAGDYLSEEENSELGQQARMKQLEDDTRLQIETQYAAKDEKFREFGEYPASIKPDLYDVKRFANLRYLFDSDDFVLGRYSSVFFGRNMKTGVSYGSATVGGSDFGAVQLMCYFAPRLINDFPELTPYFSNENEVDAYRNGYKIKPVCDKLKQLSQSL